MKEVGRGQVIQSFTGKNLGLTFSWGVAWIYVENGLKGKAERLQLLELTQVSEEAALHQDEEWK